MPPDIRIEKADHLDERLVVRTDGSKSEAVEHTLEDELHRLGERLPLRERLRPLQDRIMARPSTGLEADRAFFDALSSQA